eukprot:ANDGO_02369.mRNA.1 Apoptosis-inducing factor 1
MAFVKVATLSSLATPSLTEVALPEEVATEELKSILIARTISNDVYATGAKCTHYGAPLSKGVLNGDRIVCPWHGACFSAKSGDIEDAPGRHPLQTFCVQIDLAQDAVLVDVSQITASFQGTRKKARHADKTVAIIGGGAAGASCAEALRTSGFAGKIVIVCEEPCAPYDRPKVSKAFDPDAKTLALRKPDEWACLNVDLILGKKVSTVVYASKVVQFSDGEAFPYDFVVLATGCSPKAPPFFRSFMDSCSNVHTVRTVEDAKRAAANVQSKESSVVIFGASFIAVEMAAVFRSAPREAKVTIVGRSSVPFENTFGKDVGRFLMSLAVAKGVQFQLETTIRDMQTVEEGTCRRCKRVSKVILENSVVLDCDVLILATGVEPRTDLVRGHPKVSIDAKNSGIVVNPFLQVCGLEDQNVYACGDVASFPFALASYRSFLECVDGTSADDPLHHTRIEHWTVAEQMGRCVGQHIFASLNLSSAEPGCAHRPPVRPKPYYQVPFFWHAAWGKSVRCVGYLGAGYDSVILKTLDTDSWTLEAYFERAGSIVAVVTLGRDPIAAAAAELVREGRMPTAQEIRHGARLVELLHRGSSLQ